MELSEQKISGIHEVHITDALNASILKLKLKVGETTTPPPDNDLIIYIDHFNSANPSLNRKQYIFPLNQKLQNSDELTIETKTINNEIIMTTTLNNQTIKSNQIILLEGENYLYTNYQNIQIELIYPKNNDLNKFFVNAGIYATNQLEESNNQNTLYIKDAFTKVENKVNLEVNNLTIDCLTSKDNKFTLDQDGNLIVNSIQTNQKIEASMDEIDILNKIYPIGSIYLTANETSPSVFFGGTWVLWGNGRVPVGVDLAQEEFNTPEKTGGSKYSEAHSHDIRWNNPSGSGVTISCTGTGSGVLNMNDWQWDKNTQKNGDSGSNLFTSTVGSGNSGNLQPYITCFMWKRTA